jgi:hypothetical protein
MEQYFNSKQVKAVLISVLTKAVYRITILPQMITTTVKDRSRVFERTQHDCPNLIAMYRYRCNCPCASHRGLCGRRNKPPFTAALHVSDKLHAMAELTHWTEGRVGPGWVWILWEDRNLLLPLPVTTRWFPRNPVRDLVTTRAPSDSVVLQLAVMNLPRICWHDPYSRQCVVTGVIIRVATKLLKVWYDVVIFSLPISTSQIVHFTKYYGNYFVNVSVRYVGLSRILAMRTSCETQTKILNGSLADRSF